MKSGSTMGLIKSSICDLLRSLLSNAWRQDRINTPWRRLPGRQRAGWHLLPWQCPRLGDGRLDGTFMRAGHTLSFWGVSLRLSPQGMEGLAVGIFKRLSLVANPNFVEILLLNFGFLGPTLRECLKLSCQRSPYCFTSPN